MRGKYDCCDIFPHRKYKRVYGSIVVICEWEYAAAFAAFPVNCFKCAHAMCVFVVIIPLRSQTRRRRTSDAVKWLISSWKTDIKYLCSRLFVYTPLSHMFNMKCWLLRCIFFSSPCRGFLWRLNLNTVQCCEAIIRIRWNISMKIPCFTPLMQMMSNRNERVWQWRFIMIKSTNFYL